MTPTHIIALVARLFAIALFLIAVRDIFAAISVADDSVTTRTLIPLYAAGIASLFAAAMLWAFPLSIAKKIYPIKQEKASHQTLSLDDFYYFFCW
jgi:hypothetical protein